jgi:hypothetical protein
VGLYVFQDFVTFAFQKLNKLVGLKMPFRTMSKIIIDGSKHRFNFRNQTQRVQTLNYQVGVMKHVMDTAHKWSMFMHELRGNDTFNTMKNYNPICTKINQFPSNVTLIQPPYSTRFWIIKDVKLLIVDPSTTFCRFSKMGSLFYSSIT